MRGFDYSQSGLYFVTFCVQDRLCLFTRIRRNKLELNEAGRMVQAEWEKLPMRFLDIRLHEFVVMPNHFHAIIEIEKGDENGDWSLPGGADLQECQVPKPYQENGFQKEKSPGTKKLGQIVGAFKSITTVKYIEGVKTRNWPQFDGRLWQRSYWEHVIRNETAYRHISGYIITNPEKWAQDRLNMPE
ncbi:REP element-mobilizing transposase RayT [Cyclonatronum proteinivorum]|uniref:REP element-mobilizing transposase RayT n=1 Tax=Cyclonatronum proteinivorum TaxID=1457365 RepID=A0A345UPT2_9BACT|nr:REP element-mobilizing transposase RayT [Cyclonatronum proteinivorum]